MDSEGNAASPPWPEPVQVSTPRDEVAITHLTPKDKVCLWQHLKDLHPQEARHIAVSMQDPLVAELLAQFDAAMMLDKNLLPPTLRR